MSIFVPSCPHGIRLDLSCSHCPKEPSVEYLAPRKHVETTTTNTSVAVTNNEVIISPNAPKARVRSAPYRKLTEEERLQTGLLRVVRQVKLFWRIHGEPLALRAVFRYFRMGTNNISDFLDVPPLSDEVIPLIKRSGAILLMPKAAWDGLSYEERAAIKQELNKPMHRGKIEAESFRTSRGKVNQREEIGLDAPIPMEDFE
jgi:hypothetical protein